MGNLEIKNLDKFKNNEEMIDISGCKLEPITDDNKPNKYHPIYMYIPEKRTMDLGYMDEDNAFRTINGNPVDLTPSCYMYCPTNEEGYYILNYENYDISSDVILDSDYYPYQDIVESQKPFNLYDAFIREYGNDYEQIKFVVHNHKLYLGIKYNGDYHQVERFMKAFTDPSIKVPNDIEIYTYYTKHETKYNIFAHATPGTCSHVTVGDYIFRSNDDFHFFAKTNEEVEADNDNYIEIDPVFAGVMLRQITYYHNRYKYIDDILKEKKITNKDDNKINGVVLKFNGTKESADAIDVTLVKLQEMDSNLTFEITDENGYTFKYTTFRLVYDNEYDIENNQAFLIKYNFRYIDTPLELYCDFPDVEVWPVKEGEYIIFDSTRNLYKNNNYIIRIVKDEKTAKRILNHIVSKIDK